MRCATMVSTMSSPIRPPLARIDRILLPRAVFASHSARNISPVEMAGILRFSTRNDACVPLPHPGGPNNKMIITPQANLITVNPASLIKRSELINI